MIRAALLCLALATSAQAQSVAEAARIAAGQLAAAQAQLDRAEGAQDRVAALTDTIRGFEAGLAALRDGLRAATIREMELTRALSSRETETAQLMAALQAISRAQGPQTTLHPDGPLATARAGMIVAALTPGLAERALALRDDLDEVSTLRRLQQEAAGQLQDALLGVQQARLDLTQAMAERTDLPRRFTADPVRTAILIGATETLEAFASGLAELSDSDIPPSTGDIATRKGQLPLPVSGQILRRAGQADAAGVKRPGIILATRPGALVTTPAAATIRYRGPLLDYGLVTILEPQPDLLIVLAGLETVFGEIGEVLPEGSPVGLMGGQDNSDGAIVSLSGESGGERAGTDRSETLYIEVRQGDTTVDPLTWFSTGKG